MHKFLCNKIHLFIAHVLICYLSFNIIILFHLQSWDDELELMSLRNALDCEIQHDQCHKTEKYKKPGQNLGAFCSNSRNGPSIGKSIREVVQDWYDEYKHVPNLDEVESLGSSRARKPIGHWSQFVQSKSQRIGCSVVKFTNDDKNNCIVIGCNYSAGNLAGYPIFSFGTPASLCKTGANQQYPGLCSPNEDFSQHKNGDVYFENNAPDSPVVKQWLENGKKLDHWMNYELSSPQIYWWKRILLLKHKIKSGFEP